MTRHVLTLCLIASLLANQGVACIGFAHTDVSNDHSSRPHVHLGHQHTHGPNGHHHSRLHDEFDFLGHGHESDPIGLLAFQSTFPFNHDSDAFYFVDPVQSNTTSTIHANAKSTGDVAIPGKMLLRVNEPQARLVLTANPPSAFAPALYLMTNRLLL